MTDSKMMEDSKLVAEYDGVELYEEIRHTNGDYFDTIEKELPDYHTSFNSLIPVWSKAIKELNTYLNREIGARELFEKFQGPFYEATDNNDIQSAFNTTVNAIKFIKSKR